MTTYNRHWTAAALVVAMNAWSVAHTSAQDSRAPDPDGSPMDAPASSGSDDQATETAVRALRAEATRRYRAGHYAAAAKVLQELVALTPDDAGAHASLGKARLEAGDTPGAIEALRRATELAPDKTNYRRLLEHAQTHRVPPPPEPRTVNVAVAHAAPAPAAASRPPSPRSSPRPPPIARDDGRDQDRILHGFRLGYVVLANYDEPGTGGGPADDPHDNPSLKQRAGLESPHLFLLGYEVTGRLIGHDWLNVILIGNLSVTGLEQSKFFPSGNGLVGFEVNQSFQLGFGVNLAPVEYKPAHMMIAAGWTPRVGDFHVPVHTFFVPDVDGAHKMGITLGVNWD